ncbi:uncharacterized protein N7459_000699 [Penicillium hispanicum]|uniref:uncharacterized protein n=1 Tax=Penicillium hispanicum TaxID=1080232 RepID=UPI0025400B36|nr:uncharacterized protein N7459_000699 [Penicillium hispanicum]KAJ5594491.1 hypothetical protein N7459_000699 [Penicillium hispanicum]
MPVSHLTLTVSHLPTSTSFFLSCLQPLGYQFIGRHDDYIGFGQKQGEPADFWITEQKPGISASAVHVAFPSPSQDAVGAFFISALKAGGKIHGEPKMRDSQSGYFSAAVIDFDGNSIEAVYRPGNTNAVSEAGGPTIAMLENGSVVSKSSKATTVKPAESVVSSKSRAISKAPTAIERAAPTVVSRQSQGMPPAYTVQATQKTDDGSKAAKTIVGTLIGAAAGAAIAYAMVKGDSQSSSSETNNPPPPQYTTEYPQLMGPPSQASQAEEPQRLGYQAIEAPPPRSVYTASAPRTTVSRSVTSKNPRASTIYEATEFFLDENGRRASDGSIFSIPEDLPLRAIEYPPPSNSSQQRQQCSPSTFISSYAADKPRVIPGPGSVHSASTIRTSQTGTQRRHSYDDRSSQSHHSHVYRAASTYSHQSATKSIAKGDGGAGSTASSTRTARNIPLPAGSSATYYSTHSTKQSDSGKSHVSARHVLLPESVLDLDVNSNVTPDDSISQVGSRVGGRSTHSHRSGHSKTSRTSKHSSKSKFDEPVRPADSVSQVSRMSQRTIKADGSGSKAGSKASSRRGGQVV